MTPRLELLVQHDTNIWASEFVYGAGFEKKDGKLSDFCAEEFFPKYMFAIERYYWWHSSLDHLTQRHTVGFTTMGDSLCFVVIISEPHNGDEPDPYRADPVVSGLGRERPDIITLRRDSSRWKLLHDFGLPGHIPTLDMNIQSRVLGHSLLDGQLFPDTFDSQIQSGQNYPPPSPPILR